MWCEPSAGRLRPPERALSARSQPDLPERVLPEPFLPKRARLERARPERVRPERVRPERVRPEWALAERALPPQLAWRQRSTRSGGSSRAPATTIRQPSSYRRGTFRTTRLRATRLHRIHPTSFRRRFHRSPGLTPTDHPLSALILDARAFRRPGRFCTTSLIPSEAAAGTCAGV